MSVARSVHGQDVFVARADRGGWTLWIAFRHAPQAAALGGVCEPLLSLSSAPAGLTVYVPGTVTYSWSLPGLNYESGPVESGQLWLGGQLAPLSGDTFRQIRVRWWLTVMLTASVALAAIIRMWRERTSRPPSVCGSCGYDLRASGERCPECGSPRPAAIRPSSP